MSQNNFTTNLSHGPNTVQNKKMYNKMEASQLEKESSSICQSDFTYLSNSFWALLCIHDYNCL